MMTPAERVAHERAAVALEEHEILPWFEELHGLDQWVMIAWKAWDICNERDPIGTTVYETDTNAARLLRDCVAAGRTL